MAFDGVDDYVEVPHSDSIMPPELTVEAIFNLFEFSTAYIRVLEKGGANLGGGYGLELNPADNRKIRATVWDGTSAMTLDSTTLIELGKWYHVVYTFDGELKLYIDGKFEASRSASMTTNTHPLRIGVDCAMTADKWFKGRIALVRIYNRALTPEEIRHNMEEYHNPVKDGLVLWLHDRIAGDTWYDESGLGNNGAIYGAVRKELAMWELRASIL